jgi:hypothetical protein
MPKLHNIDQAALLDAAKPSITLANSKQQRTR